jgi:hypothetical protein
MEPVAVLSLAKAAGEVTKKLYDVLKSVKDRELKQQIDEILDQLRELKHSAAELEQENRELREKLRFKSDDYVFHSPFWYDKNYPERALCPKCFASNIAAPMDEQGRGVNAGFRRCLVCSEANEAAGRGPR